MAKMLSHTRTLLTGFSNKHHEVATALECLSRVLGDTTMNTHQGIGDIQRAVAAARSEQSATSRQLAELLEMVRGSIPAILELLSPPPPPPAPEFTNEQRRAIDDKGLFVYGCARSGTTILYETLNLSQDVFLLGEACFFLESNRKDFRAAHWRKHENYRSVRSKGLYLPAWDTGSGTALELVQELGGRYRYVGEKVAVGPWIFDYGIEDHAQFFEFQAKHFYHSKYIVIIRHPNEVTRSMVRMWPDYTPERMLATWIAATQASVEILLTFPNALLVDFANLDEAMVGRLGQWLGVEILVPAGRFSTEFRKSAGGKIPPEFSGLEDVGRKLVEIYERIIQSFDPETFLYTGRTHPRQFGQQVVEELRALQNRLVKPVTSTVTPGTPLPVAG